ncbi:DUF3795 domain-containing protein [Myxococcota bacterium]|nr:DUF3795 domain-containing protein [Myxococcota bacterium]
MISPCGINCSLCSGHQRKKNTCPGCSFIDRLDESSLLYCRTCKIVRCDKRRDIYFCNDCRDFPCRRLKDLNKRYTNRYGVNNFENMNFIKLNGIAAFLDKEAQHWTCSECNELLCMHKKRCLSCGSVNPHFPQDL